MIIERDYNNWDTPHRAFKDLRACSMDDCLLYVNSFLALVSTREMFDFLPLPLPRKGKP